MAAQTSIGSNDGSIQSTVILAGMGPYTIDFPFFSKDDVVVTLTESNGNVTTFTRGVHYNVTATANDDGIYPSGTVDMLGAGMPAAGTLTRYRVTGIERVSQIPLVGTLSRVAINADLNRVSMAAQDNRRAGDLALRFPDGDTISPILTTAALRANMALLFDGTGKPYAGAQVSSTVSIASWLINNFLAAGTSAALSRTALGAAGLTGETFTGANSFTGGLITVPTASVGDSDTSAASTAFVQAATGKVYMQTFTATGTYTPHAGMVNCIIETVGGGGGGGGTANSGGANQFAQAGGGGAGSCSTLLATAATIGASKAVTIGAAGAAGSSGANNGGAGGDTSVGTLCIGKGGSGGLTTGTGGTGGVAGTGTVTPTGAPGGGGMTISTSGLTGVSTTVGGSGSFGSGGVPTLTAGVGTGGAASGYGAGGAGAASANAAGAAAGGAGTAGYVKITEFCNQ